MIVSTAALLFVRLSVLQFVSTGWPSTHSLCSVWLQAPPPSLPGVHPHLSIMSLHCSVFFTCSLPTHCSAYFLFTLCFQLRWLQHGAFLIDLNKAFPNESFNLVAPPHFLSFFFSLILYLSLTFSSLEVGTLPHFHCLLFLLLHCVAGF